MLLYTELGIYISISAIAICQFTSRRKFRTVQTSSNLQHLETTQLVIPHQGTGERWKFFVDKIHTCMLSGRPTWMLRHDSVGEMTGFSASAALHAHLRGLPARRMLPNKPVELLITTELCKNEPLTATAKVIIRFVRIHPMKR